MSYTLHILPNGCVFGIGVVSRSGFCRDTSLAPDDIHVNRNILLPIGLHDYLPGGC